MRYLALLFFFVQNLIQIHCRLLRTTICPLLEIVKIRLSVRINEISATPCHEYNTNAAGIRSNPPLRPLCNVESTRPFATIPHLTSHLVSCPQRLQNEIHLARDHMSSFKPPSLVMPMILFNTLNRPLPAIPRKVLRSYGGKGIVGVKTCQSVGEIATLAPKIIMNKKIRRCPVSSGMHAVTSVPIKRHAP